MDVIAITGGIATGKSTVAEVFAKRHGIAIIDSDHIAKELTNSSSPIFKEILNKFGNTILSADNTLNRKALRELIFNNKEYKKWLEQLLHPLINKKIRAEISLLRTNLSYNKKYCLILIPLLDEHYLNNNLYINKIIIITTDRHTQITRATTRDTQSADHIQKIIEQQPSENERLRLNQICSCEIINNNGSLADLNEIIDKLHTKFSQ